MRPRRDDIRAPEIVAEGWLNSEPQSMAGLRGRVVLVEFWDYTCVNCLRTLPHISNWARRYETVGLTVLSVHAPELPFAREASNVTAALRALGVRHPVVLDGQRRTWRAFANRYLPARYLIDRTGLVRYYHFGDGATVETERVLRSLLAEGGRPDLELPEMRPLPDADDSVGGVCESVTPELQLGLRSGRFGNSPGEFGDTGVAVFCDAGDRDPDRAYLRGHWILGDDGVEFAGEGEGAISVLYLAAEVNVVLDPGASGSVVIDVRTAAGGPMPVSECGVDAESRPDGRVRVRVDAPRTYSLVQSEEVGEGGVQLLVPAGGVGLRVYAFTFMSQAWPPFRAGLLAPPGASA